MMKKSVFAKLFLLVGVMSLHYTYGQSCITCDGEIEVSVEAGWSHHGALDWTDGQGVTLNISGGVTETANGLIELEEVLFEPSVVYDVEVEWSITDEGNGEVWFGDTIDQQIIALEFPNSYQIRVNGDIPELVLDDGGLSGSYVFEGSEEHLKLISKGCVWRLFAAGNLADLNEEGDEGSYEFSIEFLEEEDEGSAPGDSGSSGASSSPSFSPGRLPFQLNQGGEGLLLPKPSGKLRLDLGGLGDGFSAGNLHVDLQDFSSGSCSPEILSSFANQSIDVAYKAGTTEIQQIQAFDSLVDVQADQSGEGFEISFFEGGVFSDPDGPVQVVDPGNLATLTTWRFENPGDNPNNGNPRIKVTQFEADGLTEVDSTIVEEIADGLSKITHGGDREERIWWEDVSSNGTTLFREIRQISDLRNAVPVVVQRSEIDYQLFTWGWEEVRSAEGPVGSQQETIWTYDDDPTDGDDTNTNGVTGSDLRFSKILSISYPDGSWVYNKSYDHSGRVINQVLPWKDTTLQDAINGSIAVRTICSETFLDVECLAETINGILIKEEFEILPSSSSSSTSQKVGIWKPATLEFSEEDPLPEQLSDGEFKAVETLTMNVSAISFESIPYQSIWIRSIRVSDETVFTEQRLYTGGTAPLVQLNSYEGVTEVLESTHYLKTVDPVSEWTTKTTVRNPGAQGMVLVTEVYDERMRLRESTDAYGVTTYHEYDVYGQLKTERRLGLTTTYDYDVLGRIETTTVTAAGSNEVLVSSTEYGPLGDVVSSTSIDGLTTRYHPSATAEGNRQETVIRPDSQTEVTTYYLDGQLKSLTGTGVVNRHYDYLPVSVSESVGEITTKEFIGSSSSLRFNETTVDSNGRAYLQSRPTFGGAGTYTSTSFYDSEGRIEKVTQSGLAPILYEYDAVLGRLFRQGRDVDPTGDLSEASSDQLTETSNNYVEIDDIWYREATSKQWVVDDSDDSEHIATTIHRTQVSDLPNGILSRSVSIDSNNVETTSSVTRTGNVVTTMFDDPRSSNTVLSAAINGQLISQNSNTVAIPTEYRYDKMERLELAVGPQGEITRYAYYPNSRSLLSVTPPVGPITTYSYKPEGENGAGQIATTFTKDRADQSVLSQIDYGYDGRGNLISERGSGTYPKDYLYDPVYPEMIELKTYREEDGAPDVTKWIYDEASGLLARKEYADGQGTDYTYHDSGLLHTRTWARSDASGRLTTTYTYDELGNPDEVTYSDNVTPNIDFDYNRAGRMVGVEDVTGVRTLEYQPDGQLISDAIVGTGLLAGFTLTNGYGIAGHGLRDSFAVTKAGTTTVTNVFQYQNGRLWKASQGSVASEYGYHSQSGFPQSVALSQNETAQVTHWTHRDLGGRITGQLARQGSGATGSILSSAGYRYDSKGRRQRLTREDGTRWEYGYNSRDEVESGKKRLPNNGAPLAGQQFAYNYDEIGNRTTAQYGGDESGDSLRTITYTLKVDHDSSVNGNINQYGKIEYDGYASLIGFGGPTSQVIPEDPNLLTNPTQANQSDRWWREMQLETPAQTHGLFADLSFEEDGTSLADSEGHLWLNPTSYEPQYDLDGNLTSDARWDYIWNGENRLISMTTKPSAQSAGHPWMRLTFAYDWQGRRVQKKVEENTSGNVTKDLRYLYDGWNLIAEYQLDDQSSQFTLQNSLLWGLDLGGTQQGAGGVGGLLAVTQHMAISELSYFPSYDGNGNIVAWLDESGAVVQRNDYDPFGNLISQQGSIEDLNYGFSTKYTDEETGLCYYGYRYYDPVTGRWPSRDPIEERFEAGEFNLYAFVGNDSMNWYDVHGLQRGRNGWSPPNQRGGYIPASPFVDGRLKDALGYVMESCFLRCWLTGLSDEDIDRMIQEIEDSVPYDQREQFKQFLGSLPGSAGSKFLVVANQSHKVLARTPQRGAGFLGAVGGRVVPRAVKNQIVRQSIKAVGANGFRYFGRVGSKVIPIVGQIALVFEVANVCKCKIACDDDGKFTDDEKFFN